VILLTSENHFILPKKQIIRRTLDLFTYIDSGNGQKFESSVYKLHIFTRNIPCHCNKSFYCFRYAKLVYEDLVKNPIQTLSDLYQKLELPIDIWSIKAALR
jgi:hypothetical protein